LCAYSRAVSHHNVAIGRRYEKGDGALAALWRAVGKAAWEQAETSRLGRKDGMRGRTPSEARMLV